MNWYFETVWSEVDMLLSHHCDQLISKGLLKRLFFNIMDHYWNYLNHFKEKKRIDNIRCIINDKSNKHWFIISFQRDYWSVLPKAPSSAMAVLSSLWRGEDTLRLDPGLQRPPLKTQTQVRLIKFKLKRSSFLWQLYLIRQCIKYYVKLSKTRQISIQNLTKVASFFKAVFSTFKTRSFFYGKRNYKPLILLQL